MLKPVDIVFYSIVWHYYLLGVTCQAHLHCSDLQTILLPTLRQHLKMIISYSIVLHYFILSIPSYFWTIYYLVCQSTFKTHQLILDWQYEKKIPNQNLSLRNVKKKHKTKEPLVMIEPLISLFTQDDFDHIWCRSDSVAKLTFFWTNVSEVFLLWTVVSESSKLAYSTVRCSKLLTLNVLSNIIWHLFQGPSQTFPHKWFLLVD